MQMKRREPGRRRAAPRPCFASPTSISHPLAPFPLCAGRRAAAARASSLPIRHSGVRRAQSVGLVVDDGFELGEEVGDYRELWVGVAGA
jgi:hypothetical protein